MLDAATLQRALTVLLDHATDTPLGAHVVTNPERILSTRNIPPEALDALAERACVVRFGERRWKVCQGTLSPNPEDVADPEPEPADDPPTAVAPGIEPGYVIIMDVENVQRSHEEFGIRFDPLRMRDRARELGPITLAFAVGNFEAISHGARELLRMASFGMLHCTNFHGRDGRKDTTDQYVVTIITRLGMLPGIRGIIVASDDRDFIDVFHLVRDAGHRVIAMTLREQGALARAADMVIPMYAEHFIWNTDVVVEQLKVLPVLDPARQARLLERMADRSPFVVRVLGMILALPCFGEYRTEWTDQRELERQIWTSLDQEERRHVTRKEIASFLSLLRNIGVIRWERQPTVLGPRVLCAPNWDHPFCAHWLEVNPVAPAGPTRPIAPVAQEGGV